MMRTHNSLGIICCCMPFGRDRGLIFAPSCKETAFLHIGKCSLETSVIIIKWGCPNSFPARWKSLARGRSFSTWRIPKTPSCGQHAFELRTALRVNSSTSQQRKAMDGFQWPSSLLLWLTCWNKISWKVKAVTGSPITLSLSTPTSELPLLAQHGSRRHLVPKHSADPNYVNSASSQLLWSSPPSTSNTFLIVSWYLHRLDSRCTCDLHPRHEQRRVSSEIIWAILAPIGNLPYMIH